jgi:hypothetical protein
MRRIFFGLLIVLFSGLASAQQSIREVDFKNFTYPLSGPLLGHSELKWLGRPEDGYSKRKPIHLVNGDDLEKVSSFVMEGHEYSQFAGFTLQSVEFADLTGEGTEDAIVSLLYRTGGHSEYPLCVYLFVCRW